MRDDLARMDDEKAQHLIFRGGKSNPATVHQDDSFGQVHSATTLACDFAELSTYSLWLGSAVTQA